MSRKKSVKNNNKGFEREEDLKQAVLFVSLFFITVFIVTFNIFQNKHSGVFFRNLTSSVEEVNNSAVNDVSYNGNFGKDKDSKKLYPLPENKIYFGAFPDFGDTEDVVSADKIADFNNLVNKKMDWVYFSNNWGVDGIVFPKEKVEIIAGTNAIPFIRMMPRKVMGDSQDKTFSLQKIIDGEFDEQLAQYARDVRAYGDKILLDFGVEMNGDWFPWAGVNNGGAETEGFGAPDKADGPERFIAAYRHIVDIFKAEEVDNVTWFFHPDISSHPEADWNDLRNYYPGDDYVDWVGVSAYGTQNVHDDEYIWFYDLMDKNDHKLLDFTKNKPIALLEFGVTDNYPQISKGEWFNDMFDYVLDPDSPIQFRAISVWHENWTRPDESQATLRLDSSADSLKTFKSRISDLRFNHQE